MNTDATGFEVARVDRMRVVVEQIADRGAVGQLGSFYFYVKMRQQFGVPVGSFQAVKHKLAPVYATLESSRAATRYAVYAVARSLPDAPLAVQTAKLHAVEAETLANDEALQCHAGIGFTWEHDLHFWLKRGRAFEHVYGSAREHRAAVAAALLDGVKEEQHGIA